LDGFSDWDNPNYSNILMFRSIEAGMSAPVLAKQVGAGK
jgi:hypothetical protein